MNWCGLGGEGHERNTVDLPSRGGLASQALRQRESVVSVSVLLFSQVYSISTVISTYVGSHGVGDGLLCGSQRTEVIAEVIT